MKILGVRKVVLTILVVLATLTFSTLGLSVANIVKDNYSTSPREIVEVNASWSGSGTESDPYLISSIADMNTLSTNIRNEIGYYGTYFKLTTDLDYAGVDFMPIGSWTVEQYGRVDYYFNVFSGVFDGAGHTISNINISTQGYYPIMEFSTGLFAGLGSWRSGNQLWNANDYWEDLLGWNSTAYYTHVAEVKNLQLYNFNSEVKEVANIGYYAHSGSICGLACTGSWEHEVHETVVSPSIGTIYGESSVKISNCIVNNSTIKVPNWCWAGGLVGCHKTVDDSCHDGNKLYIENCMVWNTTIDSPAYAYLSPGISVVYDSSFFWGDYHYYLCMNYDMRYCVTNDCNNYVYIDNWYNSYWSECTEFTKVEYYSGKTYYDGVREQTVKLKDVYGGMDLWRGGNLVDNSYGNWVLIDPDEKNGMTIYLKTFTRTATWEKTPSDSDGTVDLLDWRGDSWGLESVLIPKIPISEYSTSTSLSYVIFSYRDFDIDENDDYYYVNTNLLVLKATNGSVSEFAYWDINATEDTINFVAQFRGKSYKLTFSNPTGGEVGVDCRVSGVGEYWVQDGTVVAISTTKNTNGTLKSVSFTFEDSNGRSQIVSYSVSSKIHYIIYLALSDTITISRDTIVSIRLAIKSYNTQFG